MLRTFNLSLWFTGLFSLALHSAMASASEWVIQTSEGEIRIQLFEQQAPITTANFKAYAEDGFYNGTIFHRTIPGFMIQGGGFDGQFQQKATKAPIRNESDNGLKNQRGTLAMARTPEPHSATAQFFINLVNNDFLDYRNGKHGYAVFGTVTQGMDVVDRIAGKPTGLKGPHQNVPVEDIVILRVEKVVETAADPVATSEEVSTE